MVSRDPAVGAGLAGIAVGVPATVIAFTTHGSIVPGTELGTRVLALAYRRWFTTGGGTTSNGCAGQRQENGHNNG